MFKDLKIIELAGVLAGPSVGMFFSELGAKVIKIENPKTGGDITRKWKLPQEDSNNSKSAYYCSVNWNKEIVFADLGIKSDNKKIIAFIKTADIIITNFKLGDDLKFGMDYASLKKINPSLIYASINGFGENQNRTAFDVVLQAESGFMSINGTKESGSLKMPVAIIDILAGHQLKEAILLALINRQKTGKGSSVSVSLFETAIASLANQASNWLMNKHIPEKVGSLHPNIAPYGETFLTSDNKEIVLAIGTDKQFSTLCGVLGKPELALLQDFSENKLRVKNRKKLSTILSELLKKQNSTDLKDLFEKHFIPAGWVQNIKEVFENNLTAQKMVLEEIEENNQISKRVKSISFKTSFLNN